MTKQAAYALLKATLAKLAGRPKEEIVRGVVLRDNPPAGLGYTNQGLSDLAQILNKAYVAARTPLDPPLTPGDVRGTSTVGDLFDLIAKRI